MLAGTAGAGCSAMPGTLVQLGNGPPAFFFNTERIKPMTIRDIIERRLRDRYPFGKTP